MPLSAISNICVSLGSVLVYLFFSKLCIIFSCCFAWLVSFFLLNVLLYQFYFVGPWRVLCSFKYSWTWFWNAVPFIRHSFRYCFYELFGTIVLFSEGLIFLHYWGRVLSIFWLLQPTLLEVFFSLVVENRQLWVLWAPLPLILVGGSFPSLGQLSHIRMLLSPLLHTQGALWGLQSSLSVSTTGTLPCSL